MGCVAGHGNMNHINEDIKNRFPTPKLVAKCCIAFNNTRWNTWSYFNKIFLQHKVQMTRKPSACWESPTKFLLWVVRHYQLSVSGNFEHNMFKNCWNNVFNTATGLPWTVTGLWSVYDCVLLLNEIWLIHHCSLCTYFVARYRAAPEEQLLKAFQVLDGESKGFLTQDELTKAMTEEGR